jgi:hypothetical protein
MLLCSNELFVIPVAAQGSEKQTRRRVLACPVWSSRAVACSAAGDGGRTRKRMSMDKFEDIAVLAALLVFSSLPLAVIVLIYWPWPRAQITLRQGARVVMKSWAE